MSPRRLLVLAAGVLLLGAVVIGWWLISPLFINKVVDEAFPFEMPPHEEMVQMTSSEIQQMEEEFKAAVPTRDEVVELTDRDRREVQARVMNAAAAMPDHTMDDDPPASAEPIAVLRGEFLGADDFHQGSGVATIYRSSGGPEVLRFEDFQVTNGPALSVLLSSSAEPTSHDALGDYIDLGSLKGNIGNQNYQIQAGVDVSEFKSVVVYCVPFRVVFATATFAHP